MLVDRMFIKSFLKLNHDEWCELKKIYNLKDNYTVFGTQESIEFFIENVLDPASVMKKLVGKVIG